MQIQIKYDNIFQHSSYRPKILVSCSKDPNDNGVYETEGLYIIDFELENISKILTGDCGGIAAYKDGYYLATNSHGIIKLDNQLNVTGQFPVPFLDVHGLRMDNDSFLYLAETTHNAIGIYQTEPFKRIDEIKISPYDYDYNHINDLWIQDNSLFVSMFSIDFEWRKLDGKYDGTIIEYDLKDKVLKNIIKRDLMFPHSVQVINGSLHYCDSLNLNLMKENEAIAQFNGFTRGLAYDGWNYYVGQSTMRHVNRVLANNNNVSIDCGIHIFNSYKSTSSFLPLPAKQIYEILVLDQKDQKNNSDIPSTLELHDELSIKYLVSPKDWHDGENCYRWMASKKAGVKLFTKKPADHLYIEAYNFYPYSYSTKVYVNDELIGVINFQEIDLQTFNFSLNKQILGEAIIFFEVETLWSPSEILGNNDERHLGIAFKKICLS